MKNNSHVPKNSMNPLMLAGLFAAGMIALIMIFAAIFVSADFSKDQSGNAGHLGGLMNSERMTDPDEVTKEDLEKEYESHEEMTAATQEMLTSVISQYLNQGEFSALDSYLSQQAQIYKNAEGDSAQSMEDWSSLLELYRSDLTVTMNLTVDNAAAVFQNYANPEILAAAIAYSPISVKEDAFVDWSAILLPAVQSDGSTSINLSKVDLDSPAELLAEINQNTSDIYTDIVAYDMTMFGYQFRFYALGNENGYYRPYTLKNTDGHGIDLPTREKVKDIEQHLDIYTKIDDAVSVSPFDESECEQMQTAHPEWFTADGKYIEQTTQDEAE